MTNIPIRQKKKNHSTASKTYKQNKEKHKKTGMHTTLYALYTSNTINNDKTYMYKLIP